MPDEPETTTEPTTAETSDTGETTDWKADAEKWKAHSRKWEGVAKQNADAAKRLAEIEEAQKTAEQKAADKAAEAAAQAAKAQREADVLRVAMRKGLTETQAKRLQGESLEELEADADELLASFARAEEPSDDKPEPSSRPKESLKSGSIPSNNKPPQLTREDLKKMSHTAILAAKEAGQLNDLLGIA